jgi:ribosomal protein L7/L12
VLAALDLTDLALIAAIVLLVGAASMARRPGGASGRLARVERKLDLLLRHMQVEVPDPTTPAGLSDEVRRLADAGRKIEAIKLHREQTGVGLRAAKDAVEAYRSSRV